MHVVDIFSKSNVSSGDKNDFFSAEKVLQSIDDAVYVLDKDWNFIYLNDKAVTFWGKKKDKLLGKNIWEEFPQERGTKIHKRHLYAAKYNKSLNFYTLLINSSRGFDVTIYPFDTGLTVYLKDIRGREKNEDFIVIASHDLKTPLTSLDLFATLFEKKARNNYDREMRFYASKVTEQIDKLKKVVNDLFDLPRIKQGKLKYSS